jgi:pyrroline-5-carboxylate reductase
VARHRARTQAEESNSAPLSRRVAILGAGQLGESLIRGLLHSRWREPADLVATARRLERLVHGVEATCDNAAAVDGAQLVVLAVKPQDTEVVLSAIAGTLTPDQTLLSVAAGVTTSFIESHLGDGARVVRAMPNAPSLLHEGIAGICPGAHARREDLDLAEEALGHLGSVVRVAEESMDAVTAISGSGPAYFALLVEAMVEAGVLLGLSREVTTRLVVQTMFGSAALLRDEGMHPVELREAVTCVSLSSRGCALRSSTRSPQRPTAPASSAPSRTRTRRPRAACAARRGGSRR